MQRGKVEKRKWLLVIRWLCVAGRKQERGKADFSSLWKGDFIPDSIFFGVALSPEAHSLWAQLHMTISVSAVCS